MRAIGEERARRQCAQDEAERQHEAKQRIRLDRLAMQQVRVHVRVRLCVHACLRACVSVRGVGCVR